MKRKRRQGKESGPAAPRRITLERAMRLHKAGKLVEAEQAYQQLLRKKAQDPHLLYLCGIVTAQIGAPEDAIELLGRALEHKPDHVQSRAELAKLLEQTGQFEASAAELRKLITLRPDLEGLHINLALVLKRLGNTQEAVAACKKALSMNPNSAEAHSILGDLLKESCEFGQAVAAYRRALALNPGLTNVYRPLLATLRSNDQHAEASEVLKEWRDHEPDNPIVQHMMAAYCGEATPSRASDDYVREVFDEFAATFDQALHGLNYQGPQLIGAALEAAWPGGIEGLEVLDAGCGTGLCAPYLRPLAQHLVGVDLSPVMIQRAQKLDLYDHLVETELTDYLRKHAESFDIIAAADTFNYFGALEPLLAATSQALKENGILVCTLEQEEAEAPAEGYQLNLHGRYSHHRAYVTRCLDECGLKIQSMDSATLRMERDQPVGVMVVRATKEAR